MIKGLLIFISWLIIIYNLYYASVYSNIFINTQDIVALGNMVYYIGFGIIFAIIKIGFINLSIKEPTNVKEETFKVE